jgi:hypothetical protein
MIRPTQIERVHYAKLVGRMIIGIQWEEYLGDALPVLVLSGNDAEGRPASTAVMCDPEGNGAGHLEHEL